MGQVRLGSSMMSLTQQTYQQPLLSILVKVKTQANLKTFQWLPATQRTKDRLLSEERKEEMHCKQESWGSGKLSRQKIPFFFLNHLTSFTFSIAISLWDSRDYKRRKREGAEEALSQRVLQTGTVLGLPPFNTHQDQSSWKGTAFSFTTEDIQT